MKYTVIAVGKLKEKYWKDACQEYLKRIQPYVKVAVREIPDLNEKNAGGAKNVIEKEGKAILEAIPQDSRVVLLDIGGKEISSEDLASKLDNAGIRGLSHIVFIIGGSSGVSDQVRQRSDVRISFGPITLPHNLARVVLLEQLYRAHKIIRGESYHK